MVYIAGDLLVRDVTTALEDLTNNGGVVPIMLGVQMDASFTICMPGRRNGALAFQLMFCFDIHGSGRVDWGKLILSYF